MIILSFVKHLAMSHNSKLKNQKVFRITFSKKNIFIKIYQGIYKKDNSVRIRKWNKLNKMIRTKKWQLTIKINLTFFFKPKVFYLKNNKWFKVLELQFYCLDLVIKRIKLKQYLLLFSFKNMIYKCNASTLKKIKNLLK